MGEIYQNTPVYYTIQELRQQYQEHKITFKQLQLYEHRPEKIPVKHYIQKVSPSTATISNWKIEFSEVF